MKTFRTVSYMVSFAGLIFILLLFALSIAHGGVCPSFEKAKVIAIQGTPNAKGDNWVWRDVNEDGTLTRYVIGYLPQSKLTGVMIIRGSVNAVVVYRETDGIYEAGLYADGTSIDHRFISSEDAEVFAKLVVSKF